MRSIVCAVCALAFVLTASGKVLSDDHKGDKHHRNHFATRLSGYNEVHFNAGQGFLRGAVSTKGSGSFHARLNNAGDAIDYVLQYKDLQADITQSHIHFGQRHTVGGIVVWLCQTATNPAPAAVSASTPQCPGAREGTVSGSIVAGQVLTVTGQGIEASEFDELVRALRAGAGYANVHTTLFTPGEIRGQIRVVDGDRRNDRDDDRKHGH